MKRSKTVALTLMSASAVMLQACDDPDVEGTVYQNLQSCISEAVFTTQQCEDIHNDAMALHQKTAPQFSSQRDCIAEYGADQCERQPSASGGGSGIWMPLMMGYFAGNLLSGGRSTQPLYRSRDGNSMRNSSNKTVAKSFGKTTLPGWASKPSTSRTQTVSRGGFGKRSSGFGWGS
jgi:uncharacterized protein YgiB involved in biofilm formation